MNIMSEGFIKEKFWCHYCDYKHVDSEDQSTGLFFYEFGHPLLIGGKVDPKEYHAVVWAVCNDCLNNRNKDN